MTSHFTVDAFTDATSRRFAEAVSRGDIETAIAAGRDSPGGLNTLGSEGETGLLLAVEQVDAAMVDALIAAGADANGGPDAAPIALAIYAHDLSVARQLIKAGADPNGRLGGEPALYRAALIGAMEAVEILLSAKAAIDEPDSMGSPPSFAAASAGHWTIVDRLLDRGASPWATNQAGFTLGAFAAHSRLTSESEQGQARDVVIQKLKASGFPWPPPSPADVRARITAGEWPPKRED